MIHNICVWYSCHDTHCLYLVSMIHNIYVQITSPILWIVRPIKFSIYNYWRHGDIVWLVTVTSRNLWKRPAYVLLRDLTELPAKFDHDLSKTVTSMRYSHSWEFGCCTWFAIFNSINAACDQSQRSKTLCCDWSHAAFIKVNFSKLTHSKICRNYFVCSRYHLCKISDQIMSAKLQLPIISWN